MAAVGLLSSLGPADAGPNSLPDSVLPCVPCHNGGNRAQVAEWLASPYSEREGGRGCSDCHGPRCSGIGDERSRAADHPTAALRSPEKAARLTVTAACGGDAVKAEVAVSNVGAGHLLPTGSAKRSLVLEIAAHDGNQIPLPLWVGSNRTSDAWASVGVPGRGSINDSQFTGSSHIAQRLLPFATHVSRYRFVAPESGPARVSARLFLVPATGPALEIAHSAVVCQPSGETP